MKKSKLFLKSLIGIPVGIFALELINILLSISYGSYVRLDCMEGVINLNSIIKSYIYCAFSSYIITICLLNSVEIDKSEISVLEKSKESNKLSIPLMILIFIVMIPVIIINPDDSAIFGFVPSFLWTGLAMMIVGIKCLIDRYTIKEINKKLKETIIKK